MNTIIIPPQIQFMSSLEIAELTDKLHKNVVRDIREMLCKLDGSILSHEKYQELKDDRGYTKEFLLNKNLTLTLMTGYDVNTRHKINVRWQELEKMVAQPVFDISNPHHLLQAIEMQAKQNIELSQKVEVLEPKANALDTIANAEGSVTLDQAAKLLGVQPKKFLNPWLENNKWCFRRSGELNPYQDKVDKKYLIAVYRTYQGRTGEQHNTVQTRVTSLGMTQLTIELKKWQEAQLKEKAA